jgi:dipeptidyl aminopeptidase/acylaminoacyl peptidase
MKHCRLLVVVLIFGMASFGKADRAIRKNDSGRREPSPATKLLIRPNAKSPIPSGKGEAENNSLWIIWPSGKEERLVDSRASKTMEEVIAEISEAKLSPDGTKAYFQSAAWATSDAIHVVDLNTKRERFLCPGNSFTILHSGVDSGKLVVNQHRYRDAPNYGSYDHYYLVDENGKALKDLGETYEAPRQ